MAMCDFIVCPEDGKIYSYQDFVQKIYLESVGEDEKQAYEEMKREKQEEEEPKSSPQKDAERIDPYFQRPSHKTRHEKRRSRNGYTMGQYRRKPERKAKNHDKWAEKKEQDKYTGDRLSDRLMGWCPDRDVKKVSAKEEEAEARKNADNDLNRYQMNCNGAYYNGLIRERGLKEEKMNDLHNIISNYNSDAQDMLKSMDELAEQINALQEKYNNIARHYAHIHECRERAEKSLDYNKILFDMYDNIIKNLVLGIED